MTNQIFRDVYRTDTLDVDQGLKLTSLTFLFTDLKGSTELYDRVGDLVAYDLVRAHFRVLNEIVAAEAGAVVKTIGDAVMATFRRRIARWRPALRMQQSVQDIKNDMVVKIGIHEGPCLAVTLNDRLDYFGQTVNIAARVRPCRLASDPGHQAGDGESAGRQDAGGIEAYAGRARRDFARRRRQGDDLSNSPSMTCPGGCVRRRRC